MLGALKARLNESPGDQSTRRHVVDAYRQLGHLDQAGRFAIGLDEGARSAEVRAYASMVRALNTDESATRRLSLIPAEAELPDQVQRAVKGRRLDDEWQPWGAFIVFAWAMWVGLVLLATVVVYGFAMAGAHDVQPIAQRWTAAIGWALVFALVSTTAWCVASRKWVPALVWAGITIALGGYVVVASVAFFW
ncbi:hypothetical protein FBY39_1907 [Microbacterium sp. SLBN-146]|nr:hypothetical protein FBY39_1907 [Microbacterium sp. SLBN-146]